MRGILFFNFVLFGSICNAQYTKVTGYILEKHSLEPLLYAACYDTISQRGTITDETGRYSLYLPKGNVCISVSSVGCIQTSNNFTLNNDTVINFYVSPIQLDEVTIIAQEKPVHIQTLSGNIHIPVKKINNLPSFAGQPDILKSLTFIPGVSNGKEGRSDLLVRGGSKDQNLLLMDGATIYNPYHIGGFLTGINTDIIKSVEFYKGGFPARYGGRSSSVLDIQLKDGNKNEWHSKLNLGIIYSGLTIEGPLMKEKTSLLFAVRSSYLHLLNYSLMKKYKEAEKIPVSLNSSISADILNLSFYDFNFKINHIINAKNKIICNFYYGNDSYYEGNINSSYYEAYKRNLGFKIKTLSWSVNHNYSITSTMLLKTIISYGIYSGDLFEFDDHVSLDERYISDYNLNNTTNDLGIKSELLINLSNHKIRTGFQYNQIQYQPGSVNYYYNDKVNGLITDTSYCYKGERKLAHYSIFIEDEITVNPKSNINIGLRMPLIGTLQKTYFRAEPRFSYRYLYNENISFKTSYSLMHQYMHVLSSNYYGLERETWVGSTSVIPPSSTHQITLGIFGELLKSDIEWGIEGFYKKMNNLIYYVPEVLERDNYENWKDLVKKNGNGESYGAEFTIQKRTEKFFAYLAYTLSWNNRQFQELNGGEKFPFLYDKRHDGNLLLQYDLSKMYSISLTFRINSGDRVTLPVAYVAPGLFFPGYQAFGNINNEQLPLYHRLDILTQKHWKSKKGYIQHFNVNIYNVYARNNPVYIYVSNGKIYKKSFFTIIPTISYGFEF